MSLSARHSQIMFNYECFSVINVNADLHGVLCRGSDILYFTKCLHSDTGKEGRKRSKEEKKGIVRKKIHT